MKIKTITTANIKNPSYNERHRIFVGTHTGSFKRIDVFAENPHAQQNLQSISSLDKHSRVTSMEWGNDNEILIGRANKCMKIYNANANEFSSTIEMDDGPIVGVCRYDDKIIAGLATGKVQISERNKVFLQTGDDLSRMRQCKENKRMIATGGKGRQNNLKVWNLETNTKVFSSKNLPNDYLELEVPVWDSDLMFFDAHTLATCSRYGYVRMYDTRKQRRPVLEYVNSKEQIVYGCATAHQNLLFVGSASGIVRAFDSRRMKTILHTYKGFTGSVTDIVTDDCGKYIFTSCLDRFIRVHSIESTALQYQCYVKSKATQVLMQQDDELIPEDNEGDEEENEQSDDDTNENSENKSGSDSEYDEMFQNMQTIEEEKQEALRKKRKPQESSKIKKGSKKRK
ncbi:WD repeat-containing protein 74 [Pseudolycoriella hygida]|uniref:WD repeat-containing protein 74 n=1 Tax=Pseudolycoriella hygida TaxID=35572 RepID=A0A9Q0S5T5_9DIPT|nr:WD repeat-containing protein 74 [Pseudolycoriella hygida]